VLAGKLLAQSVIAASVVAAAPTLAETFGTEAAVAGLSFAIWSLPFLLWFANGYFAVNVGLAAELVLAGWFGRVASRVLIDASDTSSAVAWRTAAIGGALAFAGAFADYMPLVGSLAAVVALAGIALLRWRHPARRLALMSAAGVAAGAALAMLATVGLYATRLGLAPYFAAVALRTEQRTGHASLAVHLDVVRRQMLTAWPALVLAALTVMLTMIVIWTTLAITRRRHDAEQAVVIVGTLAVAAAPSVFFHYTAVNYVAIHWWFAGTWIVPWTVTLCAFVSLLSRGRWRWLACASAVLVIVLSARFAAPAPSADPVRGESVYLYRGLGADLPHDDAPLVVSDLMIGREYLFEDFPYTTAYLRRPILLREPDGTVRLPVAIDPYDGHPLRLGGENVEGLLRRRGGEVYVAYDPEARACYGADVPLGAWARAAYVAVCHVPARTLVDAPSTVLSRRRDGFPCTEAPAPPRGVALASNRGGTVVISWERPSDRRASSLLEAGRAAGGSDVLTIDLGRGVRYTATAVPPGRYYVRLRARNTCGTSAPSDELVVEVE
jgi:hypothetical protein